MGNGLSNSAVACSPCIAEAKSAALGIATAGAALDARGWRHGNRPTTWLKPGVSDRMVALHAEGFSFLEISEKLLAEFNVRVSRNACIGRAKRLHLPGRAQEASVPVKPKRRQKSDRLCLPRKQFLKKPLPVEVKLMQVKPAKSLDLTIYELHAGVCHWPYGDNPPFKYCGRSAPHDSSWCSQHSAMVYVRPLKVPS